jgi:hypothetical protein
MGFWKRERNDLVVRDSMGADFDQVGLRDGTGAVESESGYSG